MVPQKESQSMPYKKKLLTALAILIPPLLFYFTTLTVWPPIEFSQRSEFGIPVYQNFTTEPTQSTHVPPIPRIWRFTKATSEVQQVVFAKIHKAASSTIQNVLLRFAVFRDLNILLGNRRVHLSDRFPHIKNTIPHPDGEGKKFDILCSHTIYNATEIAKYFSESAVRIAILREPLGQAISALAYYTTKFPSKALKAGLAKYPKDPINGFIQHPEDFYDSKGISTRSYINNRMSLDLGFDLQTLEESKKNETRIDQFLKEVEKEFDLVLMSDLFHESMILMKRYLNWSMKDIVFIKNNVAKFKETSIWRREIKLNSSLAEKFRKWDLVDFKLYEHFKPIFLMKIQDEYLFKEEVAAYKNILKRIELFCSSSARGKEFLYLPKSLWSVEFTLTRFDCELMALKEPKFISYMHQIQWERYKYAQKARVKKEPENKKTA